MSIMHISCRHQISIQHYGNKKEASIMNEDDNQNKYLLLEIQLNLFQVKPSIRLDSIQYKDINNM